MAYRKTDREVTRLQRRRQRVLDATAALVRRSGFGAAKAREIADEAGVSVGSLYSGFQGLDGLLSEVFGMLAERELRRVALDVDDAAGPRKALATLVRGFGARALTAPMVSWALLLEPVSPAIDRMRLQYRNDYADLVASIIRDGIDRGEFFAQNVDVSAPAVIGAIAESLVRPLDPHVTSSTDARFAAVDRELVEQIVQLCARMVGAASDPTP